MLGSGFHAPARSTDDAAGVPAAQERSAFRILLVDDDEVNQLVARRMLERLGCVDVTAAANELEAIAACGDERFDLVLMGNLPVLADKLRQWLPSALSPESTRGCAPAFDAAAAKDVLDFGMFDQSLEAFERQTGPALDTLERALQGGDVRGAQAIAHRIRGGAGMLGAVLLAEHCRKIEQAVTRDLAALRRLVPGLRLSYTLFLQESRDYPR
jgi:HPt (histidine-containing phosphotransfer) domain-containing protein